MKRLEQYMDAHQFLEADKKKVRNFLHGQNALDAYLTRRDLYFVSAGIWGVIGRGQLGVQDNFV